MHLDIAILTAAQFNQRTFLPALNKVLADGRLDESLAGDLAEALRISRSPGPASAVGNKMVNEVLLTILFDLLPARPGKKR